ncbi:MAG: M23 family metallopeptidase [Bacillota bacterium]
MSHRRLRLVLSLLLAVCLAFAFPADQVKAANINAVTQELLASGKVSPDIAARVNAYTALYEVKHGDTLWDIAYSYGADWELIAAMNFLRENVIRPGQILVIPIEKELVYVVQRGDTLTHIAKKFGVTLEQMVTANKIKNPNLLAIGQELIIPLEQEGAVPVTNTRLRTASTVSRTTVVSFLWPVTGRITSYFGARNNGFHHGLDIAAAHGTEVKAARSGKVEFVGWLNTYGRTVILDHGDGYQTLYAHNSSFLVTEGQPVSAGQAISKVGATGNATGPHVHFEIIKDGSRLDPLRFLRR